MPWQSSDMARQIKKLEVEFISLVKTPANGKGIQLKDSDANASLFKVTKTDDELQRVYGIVYAPDEVDSQGDWASANTIRKAANDFMRKDRNTNVDEDHNFSRTDAFVAESWIVRKNDPLFSEQGAWAVGIQVLSKDLWDEVKEGRFSGLSLAGYAETEEAEKADDDEPPTWFQRFMFPNKFKNQPQESEMDAQAIQKMIDDALAKHTDAGKKPDEVAKEKGDDKPDETATAVTTSDVQAMIAKAFEDNNKALIEGMTKSMTDTIAKAVAKGDQESGGDDEYTIDYGGVA